MTWWRLRRLARADTLTPFGRRLAWVIACLALSALPHLPHLSPWIVPFTATIAALRIAIDARRWRLPPGWLAKTITLGALLAVLVSYRTLNGVEAGTGLLIVMAGMKLLEARTTRDLTILLFAAYFAFFLRFSTTSDSRSCRTCSRAYGCSRRP